MTSRAISTKVAVMNIIALVAVSAFRRLIFWFLALLVASRANQPLMLSGQRKSGFGVMVE